MALLSPTPTIANNAKGMDLVIVMSFNQVLDNAIFGKKEFPVLNKSRTWQ